MVHPPKFILFHEVKDIRNCVFKRKEALAVVSPFQNRLMNAYADALCAFGSYTLVIGEEEVDKYASQNCICGFGHFLEKMAC